MAAFSENEFWGGGQATPTATQSPGLLNTLTKGVDGLGGLAKSLGGALGGLGGLLGGGGGVAGALLGDVPTNVTSGGDFTAAPITIGAKVIGGKGVIDANTTARQDASTLANPAQSETAGVPPISSGYAAAGGSADNKVFLWVGLGLAAVVALALIFKPRGK